MFIKTHIRKHERGLRFLHMMEIETRTELSQNSVDVTALADLLIAKGVISSRELDERKRGVIPAQNQRDQKRRQGAQAQTPFWPCEIGDRPQGAGAYGDKQQRLEPRHWIDAEIAAQQRLQFRTGAIQDKDIDGSQHRGDGRADAERLDAQRLCRLQVAGQMIKDIVTHRRSPPVCRQPEPVAS